MLAIQSFVLIPEIFPELRQGQRTDLATSGNISPSDDAGRTKDIAARQSGLGSGKTLEAAQKVVDKGTPELVAAMDEGNAHR